MSLRRSPHSRGSEMDYAVATVYSCVQGEGVKTGIPMILLRLQGCAVGCPWCDTRHTWERDEQFRVATLAEACADSQSPSWCMANTHQIASYIYDLAQGERWILVTGGEPAAQDLGQLFWALGQSGYYVQVETSGTELLREKPDWLTVSPKIGMPGGKPILYETINAADEIKFVVSSPASITTLQELLGKAKLKPTAQVCVQPVSQSQKATDICLDACRKYGWRLSLQAHKFVGLP